MSHTCGACEHFSKTWEEFNGLHGNQLNVASIDCLTHEGRPICFEYDVKRYPSLALFKDDGYYLFDDFAQGRPRTMELLEQFIDEFDYMKKLKKLKLRKIKGNLTFREHVKNAIDLFSFEVLEMSDSIFKDYDIVP
mmetsp:Transcript_119333/g.166507  ORF Transcript_119333/g.166507 Transcript_119333/m.166507 type:complete len:136 (+) Transcript_119333:157-564(+)